MAQVENFLISSEVLAQSLQIGFLVGAQEGTAAAAIDCRGWLHPLLPASMAMGLMSPWRRGLPGSGSWTSMQWEGVIVRRRCAQEQGAPPG
ncbi:hypothetical protein GQ55_7G052800 [Panicum hallii var. hallii]|uniref:Uncharacterized protein n=1 Tax=Panicum hallii var. hallii TaxID=1504633 RepID=A0A2T7CSJ1_9POAL|nr:hypothetical protein GQ55_7G052800 [Panicum hallii var. hallii]